MTQPTNTFSSYDAVGIREDLEDVIYDISPEETPFYTACEKVGAENTRHDWQTDALRTSGRNKHIEGDDTTANAVQPTNRLDNYTQIFKDAVVTPDTDNATNKAGRGKDLKYQILKEAKAQKLDIERALFANYAKEAGNDSTARELGGVPTWCSTNVVKPSDAVVGGLGSTEFTAGTAISFNQSNFDSLMQQIWNKGGRPDTCYLTDVAMDSALGFVGNNNQRNNVKKDEVSNMVDVYSTPWGTVMFQMSREIDATLDYAFIAQSEYWKVGVLRGTKQEPLAKTGDNSKRQVVTELTLVSANEESSGIIGNLS